MDELRLKLSTKFMRNIVAKLIKRLIRSKFGYDIDIRINEIEVSTVGDKIILHTSVDGEINKDDFASIVENVMMD